MCNRKPALPDTCKKGRWIASEKGDTGWIKSDGTESAAEDPKPSISIVIDLSRCRWQRVFGGVPVQRDENQAKYARPR